jgi:hypothetical protein
VWIFAGFADKTAFSIAMSQLGLSGETTWGQYTRLQYRDVMVISYGRNGIKINVFEGEISSRRPLRVHRAAPF